MKYNATVGHLNTYDYSIQVVIELIRIHTGPQDHRFGREFLYAQIGDGALSGRTNPVRIPYWADSVTVLGWQKRKLSRIVSDK